MKMDKRQNISGIIGLGLGDRLMLEFFPGRCVTRPSIAEQVGPRRQVGFEKRPECISGSACSHRHLCVYPPRSRFS